MVCRSSKWKASTPEWMSVATGRDGLPNNDLQQALNKTFLPIPQQQHSVASAASPARQPCFRCSREMNNASGGHTPPTGQVTGTKLVIDGDTSS